MRTGVPMCANRIPEPATPTRGWPGVVGRGAVAVVVGDRIFPRPDAT